MLKSRLPQIAARLQPSADEVIATVAREVEAGAKERVPVDTGDLRDSIEAKAKSPLWWTVSSDQPYAGLVELGTRKMGARPYMVPAAAQAKHVLAGMVRGRLIR